ncbi:hypothetical protein OESDEN_08343 [Oesophagostomum dentatum]|uniref:Uncharacterized protein n=1 Tax=Oesophagostomum dentatum TaxID=61180 RepID=A0A0B1T6M0_OESDE|nr:hypothetical protein OESDEN_08343 [Oesophagostomum dentatum]
MTLFQICEGIFVTGLTTRSFLVGIAVVNIAFLREALRSRGDLTRYADQPIEKLLSESDVRRFVLQELNRIGKERVCNQLNLLRVSTLSMRS